MNNSKMRVMILLIGVFFLSTSAIFVKVLDASSVVIAFYRLLFSGLMILPIVLFNKKLRIELISLTSKQYALSFLSGVLLASHYVLWFESLNYTSVASSTVIVTLQPIFAVLAGYILFKERVNRFGILGILISIIGSCFIGWQDFESGTLAIYGDLLALLAAVIITGYFYIGQSLRKHINVLSYSTMGYLSSVVVLFGYGLFRQTSFVGYSKMIWILFISMALFSTIFGQMLVNWVLKWLNATTVSVAILTEVVWAVLLSMLILHEKVTIRQVTGIAVIMIGLCTFFYREKFELIVKERFSILNKSRDGGGVYEQN